jgi:hypothetical protein
LKAVSQFIEKESRNYPVKRICEVLSVDKSSYYRKMKAIKKRDEKQLLSGSIERVFWRHSRRYGSRRIQAELKAEGIPTGRHQIRCKNQDMTFQTMTEKL